MLQSRPARARETDIPVSGILTSADKLAILAPYLAIVGLAVAVTATAVVVKKRRKA